MRICSGSCSPVGLVGPGAQAQILEFRHLGDGLAQASAELDALAGE
jgi:hypothetical protein